MKIKYRYKLTFIIALTALFYYSCDKTEPLPLSVANFKITSIAPEIDIPIQFESLSTNTSSVAWDFGDGTTDTLTLDPTHTYTESGSYTVKMTAYTEDGQKSESLQDIDVGERYLTGMFLININMVDSLGNPWDDDGSGPDVLYQLFPTRNDITEEDYVWVFYDSLNVGAVSTPTGIGIQDYKLNNEEYAILLEEIDTENEEGEVRFMAGTVFNPIIPEDDFVTITKRENGTGDIVIPFADLNQFQFYLEFEIK